MKSNKGFTLIELLAVIVILAIIALIATPTILSVIETARKGSAKSSALGFVDTVEKQVAIDLLESDDDNKILEYPEGKVAVKTGKSLEMKGNMPTSYTLKYNKTKGTIDGDSCIVVKVDAKWYKVTYAADGTASVADGSTTAVECAA